MDSSNMIKKEPILDFNNVYKSFNGVIAVDNLSFSLYRGEIACLIGPNGAGKTTVFNLISGFLSLDRGAIYYLNSSIVGMSPFQIVKKGISRTFQDLRIFSNITVIENVMLGIQNQPGESFLRAILCLKGTKKKEKEVYEKALSLLEYVGLSDKANILAENLSYGQQKLLSLARALATEPNFLLLDEPLSGLHPVIIEKIISLVKDLANTGKTLCIIEHRIETIIDLSDQVIVINQGNLVASGTPAEVRKNPRVAEVYLGV